MGYIEELRAIVGHRPLILVGSLVIMKDEKGRILLQQRKHPYGFWGLPGGLMELGESTEETARREVWEETGLILGNLKMIDVVSGADNFIKAPNGDEFYMVTVVYETSEISGELRIDQQESLDFRYFQTSELPEQIVKSHRRILEDYLKK
ncbi:8-oxo-dGTP pyrophosphatase MutT (NUDIX family) [Anoxybacillus calidus]|uniref:8-oxo-dGTP pyrophosphatase MutT (NUDIX family) n=1 Tax=[Anoxybacillus] calidus TaxID=575178 RepID=A0A7V9Z2Y1_9BACL|nr:NUDIX hydrolase [Anoxybacillus calidus]MBA2872940.1 8-oxo-dGTP pyrophosphatase MutT (NUDIX family) [Anoxybacillus calidus]